MHTLSRYLVARFLGYTTLALAGALALIAIAELLVHADVLIESDAWLEEVARQLSLKIPAVYLRTLVPISAFVGAFVCFGLAARWREITAMKAAGISPRRAGVPVLLAAVVLCLGSFLLNETLVLRAVQAWDRHERGGDERDGIVYRRGSFWYHRGGVIYNIRYADPKTNTWRGVSVFELDERGLLTRSIRARRVHIQEGRRWLFVDLTIRHFDPSRPLEPPSYERIDQREIEMSIEAQGALREADPAHLTLPELFEYLAIGAREGQRTPSARAQLHDRLVDPLTVLLFSVFAIPLGMRAEESNNLAVPALIGVGVITAFLFARSSNAALIREGVAMPPATVWGILLVFGVLGALWFARIPR